MQEKTGAVIVIPAYNEEECIGHTIDLIRKTGIKTEIIVVNDGSTDKTSKIAKQKGCIVIDFPVNRGKTNAFYAGVKAALKLQPKAVITIDADMLEIPQSGLSKLINKARKATEHKRIEMLVAETREMVKGKYYKDVYYFSPLQSLSGIRAFSVPALCKLLSSRVKGFSKGYGLEVFLNKFFPDRLCLNNLGFEQREAYRGGRETRQEQETSQTRKNLSKKVNKYLAKRNRTIRAIRAIKG